MNSQALLCGLILSGLTGAGLTHWWTVNEMISQVRQNPGTLSIPAAEPPAPAATPAPAPTPAPTPLADPRDPLAKLPTAPEPKAGPDPVQKEFFATLIDEIRGLRGENRDLRDQMAETNRDLMKLEFRVDTHSESFRPLPVSEGRPDTTFDTTFDATQDTRYEDGPGVLPPRDGPFSFSASE